MDTFFGILAILFWSTNVAFARSLTEQIGLLTSGAVLFLLGGLFSLIYMIWSHKGLGFLRQSSKKYLFGCGTLFVVNTISLQAAIGLSASRSQTVIVGLINYLWPVLSLWFSLFILGKKAKVYLPVGIALAFGGMWLASTRGEVLNAQEVFQPANLVIYGFALTAAVTWGLYSNLSRKWAGAQDSGSVPVFLLASGILLGITRLLISEPWAPTGSMGLELGYMVIFPTMLAYIFWDAAMRKGRMILVVSLSYFIPLVSTVISALRLGVPLGVEIWAAALMIVGGAYICRTAVIEA